VAGVIHRLHIIYLRKEREMRYCALLMLVGLLGVLYGCASSIDALSNNSSGAMIRGVKLNAGFDAMSGQPVPSVSFTMGSLARKGKDDRTVVLIDNNTTDIVSESYDIYNDYEHAGTNTKEPRQLLKKERRLSKKEQFDEGIVVHQTSGFGMGVSVGNLFNGGGETRISIGKVGTNTVSANANSSVFNMIENTIKNTINARMGTSSTPAGSNPVH